MTGLAALGAFVLAVAVIAGAIGFIDMCILVYATKHNLMTVRDELRAELDAVREGRPFIRQPDPDR